MRILTAITTYFLLFGCGPRDSLLTVYYRTSPRRVEVSKQASLSSLFALAMQVNPGAVEVHLKRASRVTLYRVLHYNSAAFVHDQSGSTFDKAFEILAGVFIVTFGNWDFGARVDGQDTPERKVVRRRGFLFTLLNPMTSASANPRIEPIVKEQIFSNPPITREYEIRLPAAEVVVAFRVLDETRHALASGLATTNPYGELRIQGALKNAVAIELSMDGTVIIAPIQASTKPASTTPIEPAAMPHALVSTTLANDGWASETKNDKLLPRVTLTLDLAHLLSSNVTLFGEVRLYRKISVGGLVGRESISEALSPGAHSTRINIIGGYMRYYLTHMGTGAYMEFEGLRGFGDSVPGTDTPEFVGYGGTLGYKHIVYWGLTLELGISLQLLSSITAKIPEPVGHINLGWSF